MTNILKRVGVLLGLSIALLLGTLSWSANANAAHVGAQVSSGAGNFKSHATDPCSLYYALKKDGSNDVVKVQVLGVQNGVVGTMVLGNAKKVYATLNGIDVKKYKTDSTQIQCGREAVGELSSYDLRPMNIDAGYFELKAGPYVDGASLNLR